jgi:transposase
MAKEAKKFERWSAEQARGMLAEAERSGLSDRAFAGERGIDAQRLRWWRARLGAGSEPTTTRRPTKTKAKAKTRSMKFAEVVARRSTASAVTTIEVELANGRRVKVPSTIEVDALRRLLDAVEGRRC